MGKWDAKNADIWQKDFVRKSKKYKSAYAASLKIFLGKIKEEKECQDGEKENTTGCFSDLSDKKYTK